MKRRKLKRTDGVSKNFRNANDGLSKNFSNASNGLMPQRTACETMNDCVSQNR